MKNVMKNLVVIAFVLLSFDRLDARPSDLFWTVCTTDIEETGVLHLDVDNGFTLFNSPGHGSAFPTDAGLLYGLFTWEEISAEVGFDYLGATDYPLYFNTKIGTASEGVFFDWAPSFNVGIFNIGIHSEGGKRTNQNVVDIIFGKTLPYWIGGKIFVGAFSGSRAIGKNRQGFMIGYKQGFCWTVDCDGRVYDKWTIVADYASGKNLLGGGGFGFIYNFTADISIETGPAWFNDARQNGTWKWLLFLDVDIPVL